MQFFSVSSYAIDPTGLSKQMRHVKAGAFASFEGWVRDHNEGKAVIRLDYEVFEALALTEGTAIIEAAIKQFNLLSACAVHRSGSLQVGDCAVWVGVTAHHRGEVFDACRHIIDAIKHRLPIWKKEFYVDGTHEWVNCQHHDAHRMPHIHKTEATQRYSRQMILPEIGEVGQCQLNAAKVLIVGLGGLGSSAALALAAAGIGTLGLVEDDRLDISNLHRQIIYRTDDVGEAKVKLAATRLAALNPAIRIEPHQTRLTADNAEALLKPYDIILDCSDNFKTKYLLNDAAILFDKTVIQASLYRFDGQLLKVSRQTEGCMRCLWPEAPATGMIGDCADVGVLGTVPMIFGTLQANEAIKHIVGLAGTTDQDLFTFDLLGLTSQSLKRQRQSNCALCGSASTITALPCEPTSVWNYKMQPDEDWQSLRLKFHILDVRENHEYTAVPIASDVRLPFSHFDPAQLSQAKSQPVLVVCEKGQRSLAVATRLRSAGWTDVYSLQGGLHDLRLQQLAAA